MKDGTVHQALTGVLILSGVLGLGWWIRHDPVEHLAESVPGMDGRPKSAAVQQNGVEIGDYFEPRFHRGQSVLSLVPQLCKAFEQTAEREFGVGIANRYKSV